MERIAVVLDLHFGKKCNIRLDDTDTVITEKLMQLLDKNITKIIFAGDIFENCSISRKTFMNAVKLFSLFKEKRIELYTIYGNHDEYRYNKSFRKETPLNDLVDLKLITLLSNNILSTDNYNIYGFDYLDIDELKNFVSTVHEKDKEIICIGHTFYNNELMGGSNNLTEDLIKEGNIDYLVLGHDHSEYKEIKNNNTIIYRMGSVLRDSSSKNNLERIPGYLLFEEGKPKFIKFECKNLNELLIAKVTVKDKQEIDFSSLIEEIKIVTKENDTDDIIDAINKLKNDDVKEIIRRNL